MKRIFLALLFLAASAQGATRLRFSGANTDTYESFAFDSGWEVTTMAQRSSMHTDPDIGSTPYRGRRGNILADAVALTEDTANQSLAGQFQMLVQDGVTFTSGVTTVKMQGLMYESASGHDVNQCIIGLRVIALDGTVRATLLSVANYGTTGEFAVLAGRNQTCANGDTVQATYTTVDGDYLVLEQGFQADGDNTASPAATALLGDGNGFVKQSGTVAAGTTTSGDCPENDTDTSNCTAWIEFSNTFDIPQDAGPLSRFYLPTTTAADVSPAPDGGWTSTDELLYRKLNKPKGATTMADGQTIDMTCGSFCREVDRSYVSAPLAAGVVFTQGKTTVNGAVQLRQLATSDDIVGVSLSVRIVSNDGGTQRVSLLGAFYTGFREPFQAAVQTNALAVRVPVRNSYTTVAGDRLVVEIGISTEGGTPTTPQGIIRYGESAASDCPENVFSGTTDCVPWIEFSNNVALLTERHHAIVN